MSTADSGAEKKNGHGQAKTQSWRSTGTRRSKLSLRLLKLGSRNSKKKLEASNKTRRSEGNHDLPAVVWMDCVFPFLVRSEQNRLAEALADVALARRSAFHEQKMDWPCGRLQKLSRPVKKVTFSPDNSTLLVTCCKRKVYQYDKLRGPTFSIKGHSGVVSDIKFSPTDSTIFATASRNDGTILLWKQYNNNNQDGTTSSIEYECFRSLLIYHHDLRHMIWSPCGKQVASWGMDGFVRVSDCETGALQSQHWRTRLEVDGCFNTVAFEPPNGHTVAFAQDNDRVLLWNTETKTIRRLPDLRDEHGSYRGAFITSLAYTPDGRYLVVGCHVAMVKFWSVVSSSMLPSASIDDQDDSDSIEETGKRHDDSEYIFSKQIHLGGGWSAVTLLSFTSDGRFLACSNHGRQIRIVDTDTNCILATLNGHEGRIESFCFTSDGRTLASGACDRTIRLWDTSSFCCG